MRSPLTIGQLARLIGVNVQTLRYYERLKLLEPSARRPSGYRLYSHDDTRRLRFIKNAQTLGFTLREIDELLALRITSTTCCQDVRKRAEAKLAQVNSKVNDLEMLARALKRLVRACSAGLPISRCPILTSLDEERNGRSNRKGVT